MFRTHYENLQVSRTASLRVIRAAYKSLSQQWHPDKHPDNRERAEKIAKIINEAYRVLSNPELRKKHDDWIAKKEEQDTAARSQRADSPSQSAPETNRANYDDPWTSGDKGARPDSREPSKEPSNNGQGPTSTLKKIPHPLKNYWWALIIFVLVFWKAIQANLLFALGFLLPSLLVGLAFALVLWLTSRKRRKTWKLHNWLNTASYVMLALPFLQAMVSALVHNALNEREYSYSEPAKPAPVQAAPLSYSLPTKREEEFDQPAISKPQHADKSTQDLIPDNEQLIKEALSAVKIGDLEKAETLINSVHSADDGAVMWVRGKIAQQGSIGEAEQLFKKSCEDGFWLGCNNLAGVFVTRGNDEAAEEIVLKIHNQSPIAAYELTQQAVLLFLLKYPIPAYRTVTRALEVDPTYSGAFPIKAEIERYLADMKEREEKHAKEREDHAKRVERVLEQHRGRLGY